MMFFLFLLLSSVTCFLQKHFSTMRINKPLQSNNNDELGKDQLLAKISAKEAEFQAELDKLLLEARINNDSNKELDGFSDKDLATAIAEIQKLNKKQKNKPISDDEISKFMQKMQQQQALRQQLQVMYTESTFIRVVIPPGNKRRLNLISSTPLTNLYIDVPLLYMLFVGVRPGENMVVELRGGMFEIEVGDSKLT